MRHIAVIDSLSDKRAAAKRERKRTQMLAAEARRARLRVVAKVAACLGVLALFALLGFAVGNADYQATLIGWVPFVMAVVGIALAGAYMLVLRSRIAFSEDADATECPRDSDVVFHVRFSNRSPLFATRCKASFYISDMFDNVANETTTTLCLNPFEDYDMSFSTRFEHIGSYHAGLDSLQIQDFLGLFSHTLRNDMRRVVEVTPKVIDLEEFHFSDESMEETTRAARSVLADSMDYAYVRDYAIGDPLKTIHWKLSARAGNYLTRLYELYTDPSVVIVMDFYAPSDEARELMSLFDCVVESAFSLARYARRRGMDAEIRYRSRLGVDHSITGFSGTKDTMADVVSDLPRMSNDPADAAAAMEIVSKQAGEVRGYSNVIVCSANVGPQMVGALVDAKVQRRVPALVAVIPSGLVGRERQDYCRDLVRLEADGVDYFVVSNASDLVEEGVNRGR